jgi:hypothetical protein
MTAYEWVRAKEGATPPSELYCPTRDVAVARVSKMKVLLEQHIPPVANPDLYDAIVQELTNNCFDHNLGTWRDVPGCWLEYSYNGTLDVIVADRGRGYLMSLRQALPDLKDDQAAVIIATTKMVSGRAPENRGRGLKFVISVLDQVAGASLTLHTGNASMKAQAPGISEQIPQRVESVPEHMGGVYIALSLPLN